MLSTKNIVIIFIINAALNQSIYATSSVVNDHISKNLPHKKIDIHFLDLDCLTPEDCENIQLHAKINDIYNHEHQDKLEKDQLYNNTSKSNIKTNKEKLKLEKKNRIYKPNSSNTKIKSPFPGNFSGSSGDVEFVPFHFNAPLSF